VVNEDGLSNSAHSLQGSRMQAHRSQCALQLKLDWWALNGRLHSTPVEAPRHCLAAEFRLMKGLHWKASTSRSLPTYLTTFVEGQLRSRHLSEEVQHQKFILIYRNIYISVPDLTHTVVEITHATCQTLPSQWCTFPHHLRAETVTNPSLDGKIR
jgi:hypothetical protein